MRRIYLRGFKIKSRHAMGQGFLRAAFFAVG